jgi:cysteinyl-tRNA synthetase
MDFVLWKPSKPGEPAWASPCGIAAPGRPGWHIECSAMAWRHLGETFDIHGGGIDLLFPHHENELAQSRCALGVERMAQVWMHNGFLQVEGRKMAKSEGNFVTIRDLLKDWQGYAWPGEALRYNILRTHYRQPLDWTLDSLDESHKVLWDWYTCTVPADDEMEIPDPVLNALCDDLNTPKAISELHDMANGNHYRELSSALRLLGFSGDRSKIRRIAPAVGVAVGSAGTYGAGKSIGPVDIDHLKTARDEARKAKNWAEADRIREELEVLGIVTHDTKDGTTYEERR